MSMAMKTKLRTTLVSEEEKQDKDNELDNYGKDEGLKDEDDEHSEFKGQLRCTERLVYE